MLWNHCEALAIYVLSLRWLRVQSLSLKVVWPICSESTGLSSQCLDDTESSWSQTGLDSVCLEIHSQMETIFYRAANQKEQAPKQQAE